jgi:hypothetical protein
MARCGEWKIINKGRVIMGKFIKYIFTVLGLLLVFNVLPKCANDSHASRRSPTIPTITQLPPFPKITRFPLLHSGEKKHKIRLEVIDHKLSTYPKTPSASYRVAKHRLSPFAAFEPRADQIKTIAPHYDLIILPGYRSNLVPLFRKYNPSIKVFMYFDPGLAPDLHLIDAGNVDNQNTDWLLKNHPEWFLKDSRGKPIKFKTESGSYWADPGNEEWQIFFAQKLKKALKLTGNVWDGVLLDDFFGHHVSHREFGGSSQQVNYKNNRDFQAAQLSFLKKIVPMIDIPVIPNVEGVSIITSPEFFSQVVEIAGGAENEILTIIGADYRYGYNDEKTVKVFLDLVRKAPKDKIILINSNTAKIAGDVDATLYHYFTYLLVAGRDREVYFTFKEGASSLPHYWFKEFDLDLGSPSEEMQVVNNIWKRNFKNAVVLVNPTRSVQRYNFDAVYYDVLGRQLKTPLRLEPHIGVLLIKNKSILPKDVQGMQ